MEYVVVTAEILTVLWFVNYILMINGFIKEGIKAAFPRRDPLTRFFITNAKWAIFTGISIVYVGTAVYIFDLVT
ncbi:hypothetical protein [Kiloniella antarctica]|uniref:Uncharacterized protein n=1 Tax=Kiloniella antarctica TaxID=1550907 RepID=A0ABW5BKC1_9PROT